MNNSKKTHPLKVAERAAHDAFRDAMNARDAIDRCGSPEWIAAHNAAGVLADAWHIAKDALYKAANSYRYAYEALAEGLEFAPYWHVWHGTYPNR